MASTVYLVYADRDPNAQQYLQAIQGTKIVPLRCCNNDVRNLLRHNTAGLKIKELPILICHQHDKRWLVPWIELEKVKRLIQ